MREARQASSMWKRLATSKSQFLTVGALFVITLLPRVLSLGTFITWDEPMWVYRSFRFLTALLRGDLRGTYLVGHPGVITMIAGSLGIAVQRFVLGQGAEAFSWLSTLPALEPTDVEAMRRLAQFLPAAKLPLAVLHSLAILGVYWLCRQLMDARQACLAALFVALDPFHIALSRVLHIDAAAANGMLLSLLALAVYLRRRSRGWLVVSGGLAGVAALGKSYAVLWVPLAALVLLVAGRRRQLRIRDLIRHLLLWSAAAALAFVALWPAMWVDPLGAVRGVLDTALGYSVDTEVTSSFFLGRLVEDPGGWFYPAVIAFRSTPLAWLGLAALLGATLRSWRSHMDSSLGGVTLWLLVLYALWFGLIMTMAAKKFDRYMLPVIMSLDLLAAMGLAQWVRSGNRLLAGGLLVGLVALQGVFVLSYHPYYLAYYNPMTGGSRTAPSVLPLGWGEGMDLAADYLSRKQDAQELTVATAGIPGFAPLFPGTVEPLSERGLAIADYALVYVADVQQSATLVQRITQQQPEQILRVQGMDYVWIYPSEDRTEVAEYLRGHRTPAEAILLDAPSALLRDYPDALVLSSPPSEASARGSLGELAGAAERLWYVHYPESDPNSWIDFQLSTQALLLERSSVGLATISYYALPNELSFERAPTQLDLRLDFGGQLQLLECHLAADAVQYRQSLGATLFWQAGARPLANYAVSLRLLDSQGHTWAQQDRWLLDLSGAGTAAWRPWERAEVRCLLAVPPGTPPGEYELEALVYDTDSLQNLPVTDPAGGLLGAQASLAEVMVTSASFPPAAQDLDIPHLLQNDFAGQIELLGCGLASAELRPGEVLRVDLYWRALGQMRQDYRLLLALQDDMGTAWSETVFALPNEFYPTSRWQPGEILKVPFDLAIDATVPPGAYRLSVNLQDENSRALLSDPLPVAEVTVAGREHSFTAPEPAYAAAAQLGAAVALLGYDLDKTTVEPGDTLRLTLYWQAQQQLGQGYTVFAHLLDEAGRTWGQRDGIPCGGDCPTTSWLPGEFITDEYAIEVAAEVPAGSYHLAVGMYDPATMRRLPASDHLGTGLPDDRIVLGTEIGVANAQ